MLVVKVFVFVFVIAIIVVYVFPILRQVYCLLGVVCECLCCVSLCVFACGLYNVVIV